MMMKKMTMHGATIAASLTLVVPTAFAATTVSIDGATTPVGNVAVTGKVKAPGVGFLTNFGVPTDCTSLTISGYVGRGTVATAGTKIGAVSNVTISGCTYANALPVIIKKNFNAGQPAEWPIYMVGTPAKGQVNIPIQIRNVSVKMHSTIPVVPSPSNKWPCYLKAQGTINATFNQTTQQISISTVPSFPFAITAYDGASESAKLALPAAGPGTCGGTLYTGDTVSMNGVFNVATPGIGGIHL